jgi:hypothetical protein
LGWLAHRFLSPEDRRTEVGRFEAAGFIVDLVGILTALFGLVLAGYLVYIELGL